MAWLYLVTGHLEKAEARVRRVLESFPNSLQLHFVLGWAAWGQGRTEEAVAAFEKAAALSRDALALSLAQGHGLVPALEPGVDVPEEGSGTRAPPRE